LTGVLPDKFDLYRHAVQFPQGEVNFSINTYATYRKGTWPTMLREDFAGTAAVAATWVQREHDHHALAIDIDQSTIVRAPKMDRLTCICADVLDVDGPPADLIVALNFSTFIYHSDDAMLAYLTHAHHCLKSDGLLIMDIYGGPGAMRIGVQNQRMSPSPESGLPPFEYQWEQRAYDPATARTDCRIHFQLEDGHEMRDAFRYDWRLWTPPELIVLMRQAGFDDARLWRDDDDSGMCQEVSDPSTRDNWVAYIVGIA
jgi:hypothetical protein